MSGHKRFARPNPIPTQRLFSSCCVVPVAGSKSLRHWSNMASLLLPLVGMAEGTLKGFFALSRSLSLSLSPSLCRSACASVVQRNGWLKRRPLSGRWRRHGLTARRPLSGLFGAERGSVAAKSIEMIAHAMGMAVNGSKCSHYHHGMGAHCVIAQVHQ